MKYALIKNTNRYFTLTSCAFKNFLVPYPQQGGDCVSLENVTNAVIQGNSFTGYPSTSISTDSASSNIFILDNEIYGYAYSAIEVASNNSVIQGNWIYNRFDVPNAAISLIGVKNDQLVGNTLYFCSIAILGKHVENYNTITIDSSNIINYHPVLYLVQKTNAQVQTSIASISGPIGQLCLVQCNNTVLHRLSIDTISTGPGVSFVDCVNDVINDTRFTGINNGIGIYNSTGCVVGNNILSHASFPIDISGGSGNTIKNSTVTASEQGIWLEATKNNQVSSNSISILQLGGDCGIYLTFGSTQNFITGNTINCNIPTNQSANENFGIYINEVSGNN